MMYTISKEFSFSASHRLNGLPNNHPCSRLHGHNYRVIVMLQAKQLSKIGFVQDYGDLKLIQTFIDENLDHRHLNDVFPFNPTAENLAAYLFLKCRSPFKYTTAVRVSETPNTWAEFQFDGDLTQIDPAICEYYFKTAKLSYLEISKDWDYQNAIDKALFGPIAFDHLYKQQHPPELIDPSQPPYYPHAESKLSPDAQIAIMGKIIREAGRVFHIERFEDKAGIPRCLLVDSETGMVFYGGIRVGTPEQVMEKSPEIMPTVELEAWYHGFTMHPFKGYDQSWAGYALQELVGTENEQK